MDVPRTLADLGWSGVGGASPSAAWAAFMSDSSDSRRRRRWLSRLSHGVGGGCGGASDWWSRFLPLSSGRARTWVSPRRRLCPSGSCPRSSRRRRTDPQRRPTPPSPPGVAKSSSPRDSARVGQRHESERLDAAPAAATVATSWAPVAEPNADSQSGGAGPVAWAYLGGTREQDAPRRRPPDAVSGGGVLAGVRAA